MSDRIAIEQGRPPWLPAADAEPVETLHTYDMPLVGVVRQGGMLHLFRCIEGHTDSSNLWAYTSIGADEVEKLRASGPDSFDDVLQKVTARRVVVLALARENEGITLSALVPHPERYPSLLHAAGAALQEAAAEVDEKVSRSVA